MPWCMWLLLILVLLSLMVLIVLLLLWLRRRKVATSEPMQATAAPADREPPAEPTTMITVEPEPLPEEAVDQAQEVTTEIEEAVQEAVGEAQETTAEAKAAAQEAKDEITETATETGQAADQVVQEIIEPIESRVKQAIRAEPPPDDLKIIEGIGPKISSVFQAAGIQRWPNWPRQRSTNSGASSARPTSAWETQRLGQNRPSWRLRENWTNSLLSKTA